MEKAKEKLEFNLPIQIGFFILQYAKLRMLQFYYDCLDVYVDRADFQYCEMDTDSAYMALSGPDLASVVKPHMCDAYQQTLTGRCRDRVDPEWFPYMCCSKHVKYNKRTPGLFKVEYEGDAMIGLCSKTYIVQRTKTVPMTSSHDGLQSVETCQEASTEAPHQPFPAGQRSQIQFQRNHQTAGQSTDDHLPSRIKRATRGRGHAEKI